MNLQGFVPIRRGILDHTMDGRLSSQEFAVLTLLIMLADKETGAGHINAPVLTFWLPDLSYPAAKRALLSLEEKRYVYRVIVPRSKRAYQYWVNRYEVTDGPNKAFQTNLSEVFKSKDPRDVTYTKCVPQTEPQGVPQTEPQGVPYNNKDKETDNDNLPTCIGESRSTSAHTETATRGVSAHSAPCTAPHCADTAPHCRDTAETLPRSALAGLALVLAPDAGMKWSGSEGAYVDAGDRRVLPPMEVDRRLKSVGLKRVQSEFFTIGDNAPVSWDDAQNRINGVKEVSA